MSNLRETGHSTARGDATPMGNFTERSLATEVRDATAHEMTEVRGATAGEATEMRGATAGEATEVRGATAGEVTEVRGAAEVLVIDRQGGEHRLAAPRAGTLMELIRDANLGVAAICGGMLSCGTCHVYLDDLGEARGLAGPSEDEAALAAGLSRHIAGRSRIACQIALQPIAGRLRVTIAPEE